ncbi:MAG: multicopper oxidase-domain-containing protein [Benjaminiella poitrasii]|nr:MAG: multicopper oxidase-domain-containing protein [Benjaminiella poitrasii]
MIRLKRYYCLLFFCFVSLTCATKHRYEFNVTSHLLNPDCHTQGYRTPLINGQFPGPTIHVTQGDELEVLVRNQAQTYNTTIHFHGIRQIGSVESDGVPGVTQYAIMPGTSFLHRFRVVGQAGTYFYHAHVGLQDDSVKGAFIVYESEEANPRSSRFQKRCPKHACVTSDRPTEADEDLAISNDSNKNHHLLKAGPYEYKKDLVVQISEWWHDELLSREEYYLGKFFTFDHGADSILLNGRTVYNPDALNKTTAVCQGYTTFDVEPNSVYRIRVIGSTTFRTLALAVKEHPMTLIEVDGELTEPYETPYLEIAPGQRYSALLKTGDYAPGTTFAIGTSYLWRQRGGGITENGFGYLRYVAPNSIKEDLETNSYLFKPIHLWEDATNPVPPDPPLDPAIHNPVLKRADTTETATSSAMNERPSSTPAANGNGTVPTTGRAGSGGGGRGGGGGRPAKNDRVYVDLPTLPNVDEPDWFYHQIKPLAKRDPILDEPAARTIKLVTSFHVMNDNTTRYMVNSRIQPHRVTPALTDYLQNYHQKGHREQLTIEDTAIVHSEVYYTNESMPLIDQAGYEYNNDLDTYPIKFNETVDLVFQNTKNAAGGCLLHPWHTHGHSHYMIASGQGDYVHSRDANLMNFKFPLYRDTSIAYPSMPTNETDGCGWTKVRIKADNPGFWAVHCHITTHMIQGKMVVLEEAPELIGVFNRYK